MTGSQLKYLLGQYLEETISEKEFKQLFEALADDSNAITLNQVMDELLASEHFKGLSDRQSQQLALMNIKAASPVVPQSAHVKRLVYGSTLRWMAAASVVAIVLTAVFFRNNKVNDELASKNIPADSASNDILPGGEKAMLTLSDGTTISLDDATTGSLAKQGNSSIEKRKEGQLVYEANGTIGKDVLYNTLSTPRGGQYELMLPDGTKVWLNAASSITYPVAFNSKNRKVQMSGEVYLEVAPDKSRPFIVDVNGKLSIEVLGTHFNVNSYADEGRINTTLLEGKIRLAVGKAGSIGKRAVLSPRQQAQVDGSLDAPPIKVVDNADVEEVMAWKNGYFHFSNTSLASMMRQVERWYDVKVVYPRETPQLRFAGEIKRDLTLSQLLEGLKEMGVNIERKDRTLYVNP